MSERAKQLFRSGRINLQKACDEKHLPGYEHFLVEASNDFRNASLFSRNDTEESAAYAQMRACSRASCLVITQFDSDIDFFLFDSSVIKTLEDPMFTLSRPGACIIEEDILEGFWAQIDRIIQRNTTERHDHKELCSEEFRRGNWGSFENALTYTSANDALERLWYSFIAASLYQDMSPIIPAKITRCIAAMRRTLELHDSALSNPLLAEHEPLFLESMKSVRIDTSMFPKRIVCLESLATHYAFRLDSSIKILMQAYEADLNQYYHLKNAMSTIEVALEWTLDMPSLAAVRVNLLFAHATALFKNFQVYQRLDDLECSVISLREAIAFKKIPPEQLLSCKNMLANVLSQLVLSIPGPSDRRPELYINSLETWREIVGSTPPDPAAILAERLFGLAKTAELVYGTNMGTLAHLIEASDCLARAWKITTTSTFQAEILFLHARVLSERKDHPDHGRCLSIGSAGVRLVERDTKLLAKRFYYMGCNAHANRLMNSATEKTYGEPWVNMQKLQEAIEIHNLLISFGNEEFTTSSMRSLGTAYELLYHMQLRLDEPSAECISTLRLALDTCRAALKRAKAERSRFETQSCYALVGTIYDELSHISYPDIKLRSSYNDLAIEHYRLATNRPQIYIQLTKALEKRYELHGRQKDLDECISRIELRSARHITPKQEFYLSTQLVRICLAYNVRNKLLTAYKLVFTSLRRMSDLRNTSAARYKALSGASAGYACDAAASALSNDDPTSAVELLEQGRGCFLSEQLPIQTDVNYIRKFDPVLANIAAAKLTRIQGVSRSVKESDEAQKPLEFSLVDEAVGSLQFDRTPEDIQLSIAAKDLENILIKLRSVPGFQDHTQPKPLRSLQDAAKNCPVCYINISKFRCDAIVLRRTPGSQGTLTIPLATSWSTIRGLSITMENIIQSQGRGFRGTNFEDTRHFTKARAGLTPERQVQEVLKVLWNAIVRPVIEALGILKPPGKLETIPENLPHICWCLTGPLATFLPLHAAGDYSLGTEHRTMSHVVSSYTPTVTSLARSLERISEIGGANARVLLISQPSSPPGMPLPHVIRERDSIAATVGRWRSKDQITILHDKDGLVADVMALLPTHDILHLACHGKQDQDDPLESAILLHDGDLKLREIIMTKNQSAELVYLSACQTATGDVNTPEESLNLAAGFLFSGYRGAVATMWSINDQDGADVAKAFYEHLFRYDGPPAMNSALALHCAIADLVRANPKMMLIRWIPFMYFGVTGGPNPRKHKSK